jgi:hypothetical protein
MNGGLNIAYIAFGTIASLFACIFSVTQYVKGLKKKWLAESDQTKTMYQLAESLRELTTVVDGLVQKVAILESRNIK